MYLYAPHSSTLAWKIPWTEEPDGLQSMGSLKVGHDWATLLSLFTFMHWSRKWQQLQCSCLENPRDGGAWWAAVYGVTQSRTRLKRFSSSSIRISYLALPYHELLQGKSHIKSPPHLHQSIWHKTGAKNMDLINHLPCNQQHWHYLCFLNLHLHRCHPVKT